MNHTCVEMVNTRQVHRCSGQPYNKCSGLYPMVLEIWYQDKDGQESACDGWTETIVKFCPFCGLKSLSQ